MSITLIEPVKKKLKYHSNASMYNKKPPFPLVIGSENSQLFTDDVWFLCTGRFNGLSVVIDDPEEMKFVHTMGFFGKGCLSRWAPNFEFIGKEPPIIRERQWKRRKEWCAAEKTDAEDSKHDAQDDEQNEPPDNKRQRLEEDGVVRLGKENLTLKNELIVISDSDCEDNVMSRLNPRIEIDNSNSVIESLHLTLEEAFFLSYGIGCLQVVDLLGELLPITTLWNFFRQTDQNFIENYVTYHYFRAKGWIVKSGMQFGGQFILYKKGPVFYHSSYVVIVEVYNPDGKRASNDLNLFNLTNLNRLAEASFKEVLICEVHRPDVADKEMRYPNVLPKFTVREKLMRRWCPNQERESTGNSSQNQC